MVNSDVEAARRIIEQYIDGTFNGDGKALRACFHPKAVMNGYFQGQLLIGGPEPFFEQMENNRLIRPKSEYVGPTGRTWSTP